MFTPVNGQGTLVLYSEILIHSYSPNTSFHSRGELYSPFSHRLFFAQADSFIDPQSAQISYS